jgi:hypothetical protein
MEHRPSRIERKHLTRPTAAKAARRFKVGERRPTGGGQAISCLVLAPGPDWVAVDLRTGALLRAPLSEVGSARALPDSDLRLGAALTAVELVLVDSDLPSDPSRPEAAYLGDEPRQLPNPRRRNVRHLLGHLVTKSPERPLLGTLGPSVSYGDLDGRRPSVVVVQPDRRARFGIGTAGPWCEFTLGGRRHAVTYVGEPLWTDAQRPGRERGARSPLRAGAAATMSKYLVVGYGPPRRGQVPKVVLGALPAV